MGKAQVCVGVSVAVLVWRTNRKANLMDGEGEQNDSVWVDEKTRMSDEF